MNSTSSDEKRTNETAQQADPATGVEDRLLPFDPTVFSGSKNIAFSEWLGEQVINCHFLPPGLDEIGQQQRIEGMLAGQMVAMHGAGCDLLRRAMLPTAQPQVAEALMRTSTRMMTLFARQTELLLRLRGRERQTLRIEHVRKDDDRRVSVTAEAERTATT